MSENNHTQVAIGIWGGSKQHKRGNQTGESESHRLLLERKNEFGSVSFVVRKIGEFQLTFFLAASSSSAFFFLSARTPTRRASERATRRARKAEKSFSSEVISRGSSLVIPAGMGKAVETLETRSVDLSAPCKIERRERGTGRGGLDRRMKENRGGVVIENVESGFRVGEGFSALSRGVLVD